MWKTHNNNNNDDNNINESRETGDLRKNWDIPHHNTTKIS